MLKEQALEIAREFNFEPPETCGRCQLASHHIFGYAGYEALCMVCFINANLEFDEDGEFARRLEQCADIQDLIALCEDYSF